MTLTDAQLAAALRELPGPPPPSTEFWRRLDLELADADLAEPSIAEARSSAVTAMNPGARRPRLRWSLLAAVASLVVLLVAAAVVTDRDRPSQPSGRPDTVISDPRSIDLDPFRNGAPEWPPGGTPAFLVFDLDRLPQGWTAVQEGGGSSLASDTDSIVPAFQWHAVLTDERGRQLLLLVSPLSMTDTAAAPRATTPGGTSVEVRGHSAAWTNGALEWEERPGSYASLTQYAGSGTRLTPAEILAVALALVPEDATSPVSMPAAVTVPDGAVFSGSIDGRPWYAAMQPGGASMVARLGGTAAATNGAPNSTGGIDEAASVVVVADPSGVLIAGRGPVGTTTVQVVLSDGTDVDLPTATFGSTPWFAVPIPHGLDVTALVALDGAGNEIGRTKVPAYSPFTVGSARFADPLGQVDLGAAPIEVALG